MIKLGRYLKPFLISILAVIALLYGQAQCELALPDYMSDIVNVGIQKGGIEDGVPMVIRESEYRRIALFLEENEQKLFSDNYVLLETGKASDAQKESYPVLEKENVFVLKDIEEETRKELADVLLKPEMLVSAIEQQSQDPTSEWSQKLHGQDPFALISVMKPEQLAGLQQEIDQQLNALGSSTLEAAGAAFVKNEYRRIGMDLDALQNDYIAVRRQDAADSFIGNCVCGDRRTLVFAYRCRFVKKSAR